MSIKHTDTTLISKNLLTQNHIDQIIYLAFKDNLNHYPEDADDICKGWSKDLSCTNDIDSICAALNTQILNPWVFDGENEADDLEEDFIDLAGFIDPKFLGQACFAKTFVPSIVALQDAYRIEVYFTNDNKDYCGWSLGID